MLCFRVFTLLEEIFQENEKRCHCKKSCQLSGFQVFISSYSQLAKLLKFRYCLILLNMKRYLKGKKFLENSGFQLFQEVGAVIKKSHVGKIVTLCFYFERISPFICNFTIVISKAIFFSQKVGAVVRAWLGFGSVLDDRCGLLVFCPERSFPSYSCFPAMF